MMETDGNTKEKRQILERGEKQKKTKKDAQRTEMQRKIDIGREAEKNGVRERKRQRKKKRHSEKRGKERLIHRERETQGRQRAPYRDLVRDRAGR